MRPSRPRHSFLELASTRHPFLNTRAPSIDEFERAHFRECERRGKSGRLIVRRFSLRRVFALSAQCARNARPELSCELSLALQTGPTPLVDFCNRIRNASTTAIDWTPHSGGWRGKRLLIQPDFVGSGVVNDRSRPHTSRSARAPLELCPNPTDPNTSRRGCTGWCRPKPRQTHRHAPAEARRLRSPPFRGATSTTPRRVERVATPRCFPSCEPLHRGVACFPQAVPSLWST